MPIGKTLAMGAAICAGLAIRAALGVACAVAVGLVAGWSVADVMSAPVLVAALATAAVAGPNR